MTATHSTLRAPPTRPPPVRVLAFAVGLALVALTVFTAALAEHRPAWDAATALVAVQVFALALLARRFPIHLTAKINTSVATAPFFAAALLLPTPLAAIVGAAAAAGAEASRGRPWFVTCFATGEVALRLAAGAAVFGAVADGASLADLDTGRWLLGGLLTALTMYAVNGLLVDAMVAVQLRRSPREGFWQRRRLDLPQEGTLFMLGLLVAMVAVETPAAIMLLAVPCLMTHRALRDATQLREQEVQRLRHDLTAQISHDLRNPITAIRAFAQLLSRQAARLTDPEGVAIGKGLAEIEASASRMQALVGDLVDVARLEAGRDLDLNLQECDLVSLTRREIAAMQQVATRCTIEFQPAIPEALGLWDGARLERVLANLLTNAVKFSPNGGPVQVSIERAVLDDRTMVELAVRDHGIGIPAEELPHIFKPFYRGTNVVGRIEGTGLGLTGSKHIVEQHGGTLSIASEAGKGTTVTIRLPCARAAA